MGLFGNHFPYTNFHELNIDWLLSRVKILEEEVKVLEQLTPNKENTTFIINAKLGSSNEQGGSATLDCTFDELAVAIQEGKRPVINATFLGSIYNNKVIYPLVNANNLASNKIVLSWSDVFDFTFASGNHSTCKMICRFIEITKNQGETYIDYVTMIPTIGG